ncbi:MAG: MFS transporter [Planctomycetes bacterium]|nr:MFS transporter [Planctomycetota bacterium]
MSGLLPHAESLRSLDRDGRLLFATRCLRLFGYGLISVILVLYLSETGLPDPEIGLLLTLTLVGDAAISLLLTTNADRLGRRNMLRCGALLLVLAGVVFALTGTFWPLLFAAVVGVISPSGNEVGPFLPIEQAALSEVVPGTHRTAVFAWYNLAGSLATALGALAGGAAVDLARGAGLSPLASFRVVLFAYAAVGALLTGLFLLVSARVEPPPAAVRPKRPVFLGLHRSKRVVFRLSSLFALDAFAGGFVVQSIAAYWFHVRFGVSPTTLGAIFFGANLLAGVSALAAASLARRIGLVETMVYTHIPSNVLLILVPLMPNLPLAITMLLLRFSISQMDVPTRQSYTMAVVDPDERSAASGITGVARTAGAAVSPSLAGLLLSVPALLSTPFFVAGGLKIVYDVLLYRSFVRVRPPGE